jgi:hypothetical protein
VSQIKLGFVELFGEVLIVSMYSCVDQYVNCRRHLG